MGWNPTSLPNSIVLLGGEDDAGVGAAELNAEIVPGFEKWSSFHLLFVTVGRTFELRHSGHYACGIPDDDTIVMIGGGSHNHVTRYLPSSSPSSSCKIVSIKPSSTRRTDWIVKRLFHGLTFTILNGNSVSINFVAGTMSMALSRNFPNCRKPDMNTPVLLFLPPR